MNLFKSYKFYLVALLISLIFLYGIMVGRYKVFPYQIIVNIKNVITHKENDMDRYENVKILETSLQRLLIKSIDIDENFSNSQGESGGAIASIDNIIYLSINRKNEDKERLKILNTEDNIELDSEELSVPMNYSSMIEIYGSKLINFPTYWLRVNGIFVEKNDKDHHEVYLTHNKFNENEKCISFAVSHITLKIENSGVNILEDWNTLFEGIPCIPIQYNEKKSTFNKFEGHMSGGGISKYGNRHLIISVGDYGHDGRNNESLSMNLNSSLGKIILLNKETGNNKIYASGLRNPQGLLFDSANRIWSTDHGPQGGDELNLISEGSNYGWPIETYGISYGNEQWPMSDSQGMHDTFEKPVFSWLPSIAPSSLIQIQGDKAFSLWQNDFIIGTLRERSLYRIRLNKEQIQYVEKIFIGERIRDMTTTKDGKIILLTDAAKLVIIEDGGPVYDKIDSEIENRIKMLVNFGEIEFQKSVGKNMDRAAISGYQVFIQKCSSCHNLDKSNSVGPHLNDLFNRKIGNVNGYNYSTSFLKKNEIWSPNLLERFLLEPDRTFPDNKMAEVDIQKEEVDSLIKYLNK